MAKVQINFVCFRDFMIDILAISRLKTWKVRGQKTKVQKDSYSCI